MGSVLALWGAISKQSRLVAIVPWWQLWVLFGTLMWHLQTWVRSIPLNLSCGCEALSGMLLTQICGIVRKYHIIVSNRAQSHCQETVTFYPYCLLLAHLSYVMSVVALPIIIMRICFIYWYLYRERYKMTDFFLGFQFSLLHPTLHYLTLPYPTLPYLTLPYPILPYPILPYPILPYLTLPYPTLILSALLCHASSYLDCLPFFALICPGFPCLALL